MHFYEYLLARVGTIRMILVSFCKDRMQELTECYMNFAKSYIIHTLPVIHHAWL